MWINMNMSQKHEVEWKSSIRLCKVNDSNKVYKYEGQQTVLHRHTSVAIAQHDNGAHQFRRLVTVRERIKEARKWYTGIYTMIPTIYMMYFYWSSCNSCLNNFLWVDKVGWQIFSTWLPSSPWLPVHLYFMIKTKQPGQWRLTNQDCWATT